MTSLEKLCFVYDRLLTLVGAGVPKILVGNQSDVDDAGRTPNSVLALSAMAKHREVSFAQGQALSQKWGCPFMECSAKSGEGVARVFDSLLRLTAQDIAEE